MENPKERIEDILKRNPYLYAKVGLGYDNFLDFTCGRQFYVDKTHFISEWMRSDAKVTLITRPRRFGKTTLFSTVETFFDPNYATFYTDITRCCQLFLWMNMTHHCSKRIRRGIGMR